MTFSKIHMLSASAAALTIALAMWVDGIAEPRSAKMKMPPSARALAAAPIALDEEAEPPGRALLGRAHWDAHAAALREMQLTLKSVQLDLAELRRQTIAAQEASSDSATVAQEALGLGKTLAETLSSLTETPQDEQSPADRPEYSRSLPDIDRLAAASVDAQLNTLESQMASTPIDQRWTDNTINLLADGLSADRLAGTALLSAECRGSLCRAVLEHESDEDVTNFELALPRVVSGQFQSFFSQREELEDGWSTTTIYMVTPNGKLPRADL